jgi:pseudouridine kinase
VDVSLSKTGLAPTGHYTAILSPGGELFIGAAASHLENEIDNGFLNSVRNEISSSSLVLIDCNLSEDAIEFLTGFCRENAIPCIIEPVSVPKSRKLKNADLENVLLITPNRDELAAISGINESENSEKHLEALNRRGVKYTWTRNGNEGSRIYSGQEVISLPAPEVKVADTTGAGDASLAGWVHAWLQNKSMKECLAYGHALAGLILETEGAILDSLNPSLLEEKISKHS